MYSGVVWECDHFLAIGSSEVEGRAPPLLPINQSIASNKFSNHEEEIRATERKGGVNPSSLHGRKQSQTEVTQECEAEQARR